MEYALQSRQGSKLLPGIIVSMIVVFLIDLATPLGVADGMLYVIPLSATLCLKNRRTTLVIGLISLALILLGYFLSPPMALGLWVAITNRFYSAFAVVTISALCLACKQYVSESLEKRKILESVITESFDALVKMSSEGKVIGWNKACEKIFGWSHQEAIGQYVSELIIPQQYREVHHQGLQGFLIRKIPGIINQHIEITALKKDHTEFPVELTVSAINHNESYIFSAVIRDISERKQLERENQTYSLRLSESLTKEKHQRQAIEIANAQLKVFSTQLENNLLELENAYLHTLNSLSLAAEFKDEDTGQHLARISKYSKILAIAAGLCEVDCQNITLASPMHDIGKVGIPDIVLHKNGKLTATEFELIKKHTLIGAEILGNSSAPVIVLAREIALSHHEKWNGRGYPQGLSGPAIPIAARIVALVDCFDALTSSRPYKTPYPLEMAYDIIIKERGKSFDPELVDCFIKIFDEFTLVVMGRSDLPAYTSDPFKWSDRDQTEQLDDKPWWTQEFSEPKSPSSVEKDKE